ncbi:hypothetical protein EV641_105342 [Rhodococcus sp. SMB37]|uniref:hypothetical protein n=1 Tax=Rhodococcus sp. SMB37 TaxID=2512213 RepID=UPI000AACD76E|nr:hypothetical protein [Rhodococcus sp. SMB37]TCN54317.1 hypothetical protein EV641_105342 [Rhodococcus sp. SMB37]
MNHENPQGRTVAATLLVVAGILFALFPLTRPFAPGGGADTLEQFGSIWWTLAHLAGAAAFILTALAFAELRIAPLATAAIGVGSALTLLYFGAETFALHELTAVDGETALELAELIRTGTAAMIAFGVGLLLVAVGAIVVLVSAVRARWISVLPAGISAAGYLLYIPQFFVSPTLRIAHGVLMLIGCAWVAYELVKSDRAGNVNPVDAPAYSERSTITGA